MILWQVICLMDRFAHNYKRSVILEISCNTKTAILIAILIQQFQPPTPLIKISNLKFRTAVLGSNKLQCMAQVFGSPVSSSCQEHTVKFLLCMLFLFLFFIFLYVIFKWHSLSTLCLFQERRFNMLEWLASDNINNKRSFCFSSS